MTRIWIKQYEAPNKQIVCCSDRVCCDVQTSVRCKGCKQFFPHFGDFCYKCQDICGVCNDVIFYGNHLKEIPHCKVCQVALCKTCNTNGVCKDKHENEKTTCPNCNRTDMLLKKCFSRKHDCCNECYCRCKKCNVTYGDGRCVFETTHFKNKRANDLCEKKTYENSNFCQAHELKLNGSTKCRFIAFEEDNSMKHFKIDAYPFEYWKCQESIKKGEFCDKHDPYKGFETGFRLYFD